MSKAYEKAGSPQLWQVAAHGELDIVAAAKQARAAIGPHSAELEVYLFSKWRALVFDAQSAALSEDKRIAMLERSIALQQVIRELFAPIPGA